MVGDPPPGSQLSPARGGVQSESGGCSDSTPLSGTPLPFTRSAIEVSGRRPGKSVPPREVGGGVPSYSAMYLAVCQQQSRYYVNSALRVLHPPPLALPKRLSHPCCPSLVGLLLHLAWRLAWLAYHANRLLCVLMWVKPVEEADEYIKRPL